MNVMMLQAMELFSVTTVILSMKNPATHSTKPHLLLGMTCLLMLATRPVLAEVYKCESKGKVIYADSPCVAGSVQSLPDIDEVAAQAAPQQGNALEQKLDQAVKSAINSGDLVRAKALATSDAQKSWVTEAEKQQRTKGNESSKNSIDQEACQQAMHALDQVKNLPSTAETLNNATRQMNSACGFKSPATVYNAPSRLPYGVYYPNRPHRPYPQLPYPQESPKPPASSNPADYPKPKQENFGSRFIRPEDGIIKYE